MIRKMPVEAPTPVPTTRATADERERTVARLKGAWQSEQLSADTFSARVELAYQARDRRQLAELVADLPDGGQWAEAAARWISRVTARIKSAWRESRVDSLYLPAGAERISIGRRRDCDCVVADDAVSRRHAELRRVAGRWLLRDLGSLNGTWLNGRRVVEEVEVFAGDLVAFGRTSYRLTAPR
jgi:hypothetical protein